MKHTLEPWYETDGAISAKWETGEEVQVALISGSRWSQPDEGKNKRMREESKANLSRIIACVNGCKDINPDAVSDLLEASRQAASEIDRLFAWLIMSDKTFFPSKSGKPWNALLALNAAIAKAEGKEKP